MRDFADLPNDLPRPPMGSTPKPAEPPAPPPPPPPPRLIAQGVWEDPVTKRMWTALAPPVCDKHANREMTLRDVFGGDNVAAQAMLDTEATVAEDDAIRKLNAEAVQTARKVGKSPALFGDFGCDPGSPGGDRASIGVFAHHEDPRFKVAQETIARIHKQMVESMGLSPITAYMPQSCPHGKDVPELHKAGEAMRPLDEAYARAVRGAYRRAYPEIIPAWQR